MSLLSLLIFFLLGLFITSVLTYWLSNGLSQFPNGKSFGGLSSRFFRCIILVLYSICLMALPLLFIFRKSIISIEALLVINAVSLIVTVACFYLIIKGLRNPPYKNILFQ